MIKRLFTRIAGILVLALAPASAWAAGFGVSEFGSRAAGRAYSGCAAKDSASMVYWNAAQLTQMDGLNMNLGVAVINLGFDYTSLDGSVFAESDRATTTPPSVWMAYKLGDEDHFNWSIGAGLGVPFGSTIEWPQNWAGNQVIQMLGLRVYDARLVTAISLFDNNLAIGGGFRIIPGGVELKQAVGFGSAVPQGQVHLAGEGLTYGFVFGASVYPDDDLTFSFTARSETNLEFEGAANFTVDPPFDTAVNDGDVRAEVTLPLELTIGFAWELFNNRLLWTADLGYEHWETFDELRIDFLDTDGNVASSTASPRDSQSVVKFRTGLEYRIEDYAAVRAGYIFDPSITPEHTLGPAPPDSDTHGVSLGGSYYWNWLGVHMHVLYAIFSKRSSTTSVFLPGQWEGGIGPAKAIIYGVSLSAKFDTQPALVGESVAAAQ